MKKNLNNYLQIYFFGFLFLYLPLIYGMEITKFAPDEQANKDLLATLETLRNQNYQEKNWQKILECLQAGADINIKIDENKKSLLMLAADKPNGHIIFNYLLDKEAAVNARDKYGNTALHFILGKLDSVNLDIQMCKNLLKHKADPNIKIDWGFVSQTPLFKATQRQDANTNTLIKLLIKHGANFTNKETVSLGWSNFYDCTPLASAIIHNNTPAIIALCDTEVPLIDIDNYGNTAFHVIMDSNKHLRYNNKEENIKAIINNYKNKVMSALWILGCGKLNFPKDIRYHIISMLPSYYFQDIELRENILKNRYGNKYLESHAILQIKNKNNQTALETYKTFEGPVIKSLLSGKKPKKSHEISTKTFPLLNSTKNNKIRMRYI